MLNVLSTGLVELCHAETHHWYVVAAGRAADVRRQRVRLDDRRGDLVLDSRRFVDAGLDFIDTADVYSAWVPGNEGGESETIIGKWLAKSGKRDKVVLATKVGKHAKRRGLSAGNILLAAEDSLRRLQTDYLDVYFSHEDDGETPLAETLGAYQRLIEAGKVRVIGASNYSGARLEEALDVSRRNGLPQYQLVQPEYNLYDRAGYEADIDLSRWRNGWAWCRTTASRAGF